MATDAPVTLARRFRDSIALRCAKFDGLYPQAADLEAEVVTALHLRLHGVAALLSGTHSADNWRERLRGEKPFPLGDLCRLILDPTREARGASVTALAVLARAAGYRLEAAEVPTSPLIDSAVAAATTATAALSDVTRAVADGRVDPGEAAGIRDRAASLRAAACALEAAASTADRKIGDR